MGELGHLGKALRDFSGRLVAPMPDEAFCSLCGMPRMDRPEVVAMVEDRLRSSAIAPRCVCDAGPVVDDLERRLLAASGLPHEDSPRTFATFTPRPLTAPALALAQGFAAHTLGASVLVFVGPNGAGKSHLAEAVVRACIQAGQSGRWELTPWLLKLMREAGRDAVSELVMPCVSAEVLVLDDVGLESATAWTAEQLTMIVEMRMARGLRTMVTTNKTRGELAQMGYRALASRLFAVGTGESRVHTFPGECGDFRERGTNG